MTIARRPIASIEQVDGLQGALDGKEAALGNPASSGLVLASTTAGVRSWTTPIDQAHRDALTGVHGIVRKGNSVGLGGGNELRVATGPNNVVVGDAAAYNLTSGADNVLIGHIAAYNMTTASGNVVIGKLAGRYAGTGSTLNTSSAYATLVGMETRVSAIGTSNEVAIGYQAIGGGSNTVRLGNASVTTWLPGATNVCALGNATTAFKELYLSDGTDEWKVTINTSGVLTTTKV